MKIWISTQYLKFGRILIMDSTEITAWSTVVLSIITAFYVILTHYILKEQRKSIKIAALEKKLEKVYSPLVVASANLNSGNLEGAMGQTNEDGLIREYNRFAGELSKVRKNYGHLLDQDIIQNHNELWNMTYEDSFLIANDDTERKKYDRLIEDFNEDIIARKNKYKIELDKLEG